MASYPHFNAHEDEQTETWSALPSPHKTKKEPGDGGQAKRAGQQGGGYLAAILEASEATLQAEMIALNVLGGLPRHA